MVCARRRAGCVNASRDSTQALVRNAAGRGQCLLAADGDAPEAAVDGVGGAERRHRQPALLQVLELLAALEGPVAHRREHLELRRQRAQRDFEAHLVVAGRGAAVRDHVGAELARHARDGLRLHDALGADAQRIELAAPHVAHDQEAQHLLEIVRARIDLVMLDGAERVRALAQRARRGRIDAAGVDRDGDDRAAVVLGQPRHQERGVEAAGIGQHDGLRRPCQWVAIGHAQTAEQGVQALDQALLRAGVGGGDEDGVVAGDGADDLGPLGLVDRDGDALRRADRGADHRDATGRPRAAARTNCASAPKSPLAREISSGGSR